MLRVLLRRAEAEVVAVLAAQYGPSSGVSELRDVLAVEAGVEVEADVKVEAEVEVEAQVQQTKHDEAGAFASADVGSGLKAEVESKAAAVERRQ